MTTATTVKRIICLANSRKYAGRCFVGKEVLPDGELAWIRPVGAGATEEVAEWEMQYKDGTLPQLLDVVEVSVIEPKPKDYQPENWLMTPRPQWRKVDVMSTQRVADLVDDDSQLWANGHDSGRGTNDRFPAEPPPYLSDSARFIKVDRLEITVSPPNPGSSNPMKQLRGAFEHDGNMYSLRITDVDYEHTYDAREIGTYRLGESYLTISVGEPFEGFHYKLIAGIISP